METTPALPTGAGPGKLPGNPEAPASGKSYMTFRYLLQNMISYMGLAGMACFGVVLLVRVGRDVSGMSRGEGAYEGLVTYILLPSFFTGSLLFTAGGMFLKWRKTRKLGMQLAVMQGYTPARRIGAVATACGITAGWLTLSLFGTYKAYHYTDSTTFCGLACHQVMEPEYTAYKASPHARVNCVECHIGPGADWFVKAKVSGMRQLWAVATNTYKTPIKTPVHGLRPAQGTCEQCHWPERFSGSVERVITHYASDQANTPTRFSLLMKVGGGHATQAQVGGAHWHISGDWTVQYFALDEKRQDLPYVRITYKDGRKEEFVTAGFDKSKVVESELRTMDCIDCHNRPSHIFKSPDRLLNESLDKGLISTSLPGVKRMAKGLLEAAYKTKQDAWGAIDSAFASYTKSLPAGVAPELAAQAQEQVKRLYATYFFPEHGVDHRAFVNNLGHFEYKGCERCHDGKHQLAGGTKLISRECNNCHIIVAQADGVQEVKNMKYQVKDFEHPGDPVNRKKACSSCHAPSKSEGSKPEGDKPEGSKSEAK